MLKRFEIIQNDDSNVELTCVEEFKIELSNGMEENDILCTMRECFYLDILENEHVYVVSLNYYNKVIGVMLVSVGDYKGSNIYRRTIGMFLLLNGAKKFMLIHNHPDNEIYSSEDDKSCIGIMVLLSETIGVEFMGSYIAGKDGWCKVGEDEITEWWDL